MNEAQAEFIKYAARAIDAIIANEQGPCEIVHDEIWGEMCWVCSIGGAAQEIDLFLGRHLEAHPEIME